MDIDVDFTDTPDAPTGSYVMPAGKYDANIFKLSRKQGPAGTYYNVEFVVQEDGYEGKKVFENFSTADKAKWKLKQLLASAGIDTSGRTKINFPDLVGSRVCLVVEVEKYLKKDSQEEAQRNKVAFVNPPKQGGGTRDGFSNFEDEDDDNE